MKISVAMATYNGEKYIIEQMESIRKQTRKPDEVIILDDRSTDGTQRRVNKFISEHSLKNWYFDVNDKRQGWKRNFFKAIGMTTGDIVFFSDQDDIWNIDKIEIMSDLIKEKDIGCLYGRDMIIDEDGRQVRERNDSRSYSGKLEQIRLSESFYAVGGRGCCMCAHRRVIDKYLELGLKDDEHDSQCPRIAVLYDSLWSLDSPVIKYRISGENTSGISEAYTYGMSTLEERADDIHRIMKWLGTVREESKLTDEQEWFVKKAFQTEQARLAYLNRKITGIGLALSRPFYPNKSMLIGDFAYKHHINKELGRIRWLLRK